jgi:hypothetical protein
LDNLKLFEKMGFYFALTKFRGALTKLAYVLKSIWQEPSNRSQRLRRILFFFGWQLWKRLTDAPVTVRLFNGLRLRVYCDCDTSLERFITPYRMATTYRFYASTSTAAHLLTWERM